MKTIKLMFSGMDGCFDEQDNFITNVLKIKYNIEICNNPDFLIYSVKSKDYLNYKCPRIFYTAENLVPDFNICDYGIGFHFIEFEDRYFRFPLYLVSGFKAYDNDNYENDLRLAQSKHLYATQAFLSKTEFCSFVYSNSKAAQCREDFFNALSRYKIVNSGGRYKNNIGGAVNSKLEFQLKHKFSIAFENTSTSGYTTEKIIHSFAAKTIPIYWGDPSIAKVFNPKAFINCHDYGIKAEGNNEEAFDKVIKRIKELDENDEEYLKMLKEPAFSQDYDVDEQRKAFNDFLFHIFDQDPSEAYRRNRFYWGERYERKQRIGNKVYWVLRKFLPIKKFFSKN